MILRKSVFFILSSLCLVLIDQTLMFDSVISVWPVWLREAGVCVAWLFRPNLVTNSLPPWTPGSPFASQQSFLPPPCVHEPLQRPNSTYTATACFPRMCIGGYFTFFFRLLCSALRHLTLPRSTISAAPRSPSRPKLSSFLPSHGFLLRLLSLHKTWHSLGPVRPTLTSTVLLFPCLSPP